MEERLAELEIRVSFQDKTIQELNEVVTRQQFQIYQMTKDLAHLKAQLTVLAPSLVVPQDQETPPPHY
jgi:SlyX protein